MSQPVPIHYSDWADQPNVHLICGRWTTPAWGVDGYEPPPEIYRGDEGELYTFTMRSLVSCPDCLERMRDAGPV